MTKREAIENAWGSVYSRVKDYLDKDGWFQGGIDVEVTSEELSILNLNIRIKEVMFKSNRQYRPSSLIGIEDNNGWFKFEDLLPGGKQDIKMVRFGYLGDKTIRYRQPGDEEDYTHWKPIKEDLHPLY